MVRFKGTLVPHPRPPFDTRGAIMSRYATYVCERCRGLYRRAPSRRPGRYCSRACYVATGGVEWADRPPDHDEPTAEQVERTVAEQMRQLPTWWSRESGAA
jgi:hypothetical protein